MQHAQPLRIDNGPAADRPGSVARLARQWLDGTDGPMVPTVGALYPVDQTADPAAIEQRLRDYLHSMAEQRDYDPVTNPVLALALFVGHLMETGAATASGIEQLVHRLTLEAFADHADHARKYLGDVDPAALAGRLAALVESLSAGRSFEEFRQAVETPVFGIVFTAHPTFSITPDLSRLMAELFSGSDLAGQPLTEDEIAEILAEAAAVVHQPPADLTLSLEHRWSLEALTNAQGALDRVNRIVLETARALYPERWQELNPSLITLASWVGYDLDGRADISWRDTLEKRLLVKLAQLRRFETIVAALKLADAGDAAVPLERLRLRVGRAVSAVEDQLTQLGNFSATSPAEAVAPFARSMVEGIDAAMVTTQAVEDLLREALTAAPNETLRLSILVLRASFRAHGLGLAHTHVRLNATQIHNSIRSLVGLESSPSDPTRRRSYISAVNQLLEEVRPEAISYGSIREERASARRR